MHHASAELIAQFSRMVANLQHPFPLVASFAKEELASDFVLELTQNSNLLKEMSQNAEDFVHNQPNSSEIILKKILE
jgi:hypothetical protein